MDAILEQTILKGLIIQNKNGIIVNKEKEEREDNEENEDLQLTINIKNLICPISREVFYDPVVA